MSFFALSLQQRLAKGSLGTAALKALSIKAETFTAARPFASKADLAFVCSSCGHDTVKWSGRCPSCGEWNTMKQMKVASSSGAAADTKNVRPASFTAGLTAPSSSAGWLTGSTRPAGSTGSKTTNSGGHTQATENFVRLKDIASVKTTRRATGSAELDRLLNGGLVAGSVTLVCGNPGIGKSTILLQLAALLTRHQIPAATTTGHHHKGDSSGSAAAAPVDDGGATPAATSAPALRPYSEVFAGKPHHRRKTTAAATAAERPSTDAPSPLSPLSLSSVAYVSGEESAEQIRDRAKRLGIGDMNLLLLNETCVDTMLDRLRDATTTTIDHHEGGNDDDAAGDHDHALPPVKLAAVIVDSIQTMWTSSFPQNQAGTVTQVRESSIRLLQYAKATGTPVILVGHVTKSGEIAGPRVLEHVVDTVVFIENDEASNNTAASAVANAAAAAGGNGGGGGLRSSSSGDAGLAGGSSSSSGFRILRCLKNRFGPTSEVALLEMRHGGFVEADPAKLFLSAESMSASGAQEDPVTSSGGGGSSRSGSCVTASMEGSRALLAEVQALAYPSFFAYPKQRCLGIAQDRLTLVLALLGRYPKIRPRFADVLTNVVGGLRLSDTGSDLALAIALAACFLNKRVPPLSIFVGELGLTGEVRSVSNIEARVAPARKLGFRRAIVPASSGLKATGSGGGGGTMQIVPVSTLTQALTATFGDGLFGGGGGGGQGNRYSGGSRAGGSAPRSSAAASAPFGDEDDDSAGGGNEADADAVEDPEPPVARVYHSHSSPSRSSSTSSRRQPSQHQQQQRYFQSELPSAADKTPWPAVTSSSFSSSTFVDDSNGVGVAVGAGEAESGAAFDSEGVQVEFGDGGARVSD